MLSDRLYSTRFRIHTPVTFCNITQHLDEKAYHKRLKEIGRIKRRLAEPCAHPTSAQLNLNPTYKYPIIYIWHTQKLVTPALGLQA